jgi:hypothetical protein
MNLPQIRVNTDNDPFHRLLRPSEEVLVKCTSLSNIVTGVYYHGLFRWVLDGVSGDEFWQYRTCENFNKDWSIYEGVKV